MMLCAVHQLSSFFLTDVVPRAHVQLFRSGRFEAFDYGATKNLAVYGTPQPLDFGAHFDKYICARRTHSRSHSCTRTRTHACTHGYTGTLQCTHARICTHYPPILMLFLCRIDIPIHFVMGLLDTLISPINVLRQFALLSAAHPALAYLKVCFFTVYNLFHCFCFVYFPIITLYHYCHYTLVFLFCTSGIIIFSYYFFVAIAFILSNPVSGCN